MFLTFTEFYREVSTRFTFWSTESFIQVVRVTLTLPGNASGQAEPPSSKVAEPGRDRVGTAILSYFGHEFASAVQEK